MTEAPFRGNRTAAADAPTQRAKEIQSAGSKAQVLEAEGLSRAMPGVVAGFSTALPPGTDRELTPQIKELLKGRGAEAPWHPVLLAQIHSARVLHPKSQWVPGEETFTPEGRSCLEGDGLQGRRGDGHLFVVKTADCVPVLAVHTILGAYAALHAGWRGTAEGILPHLLDLWARAGGDPGGVHLSLGPHIGRCCYEVGPECVAAFHPRHLRDAVAQTQGRPHLSLAQVLVNQAREAGVPAGQVDAGALCTRCHVDAQGGAPFASYRRDSRQGTRPVGRNVSFIAVISGK